jgi:hypothetical protein
MSFSVQSNYTPNTVSSTPPFSFFISTGTGQTGPINEPIKINRGENIIFNSEHVTVNPIDNGIFVNLNTSNLIGPTGAPGINGLPGSTGADGAQGLPGPTGADGAPGLQGPTGADGAPGLPGPTGADGAPGLPGPTGADGAQGLPGPTGADGAQGLPGPTGADGAQGLQGPTGADGAPGLPGPTGPAGTENLVIVGNNSQSTIAIFPPLSTETSIVSLSVNVVAGQFLILNFHSVLELITTANWTVGLEFRLYKDATLLETLPIDDNGSSTSIIRKLYSGTYIDTIVATGIATYQLRVIITSATNITTASSIRQNITGFGN